MDAHPLYVRIKKISLVELFLTHTCRRTKPKPCNLAHTLLTLQGSSKQTGTKEQLSDRVRALQHFAHPLYEHIDAVANNQLINSLRSQLFKWWIVQNNRSNRNDAVVR